MIAYCERCQQETETVFLTLSSGHILNGCAVCRTARRGRPYVSKEFAQANTPTGAEGKLNELHRHASRS
jgi:hypothetical protein